MHIQIHRSGIQPECEICGRILKNSFSYKRHMEIHDEISRKFKCPLCDKRFHSDLKLKEHVGMKHTREFPFSCRICGRGFRKEVYRRSHEKKEHKEEYERFWTPDNEGGEIQEMEYEIIEEVTAEVEKF